MFGHRFFGARTFGPRYFGPGALVVVVVDQPHGRGAGRRGRLALPAQMDLGPPTLRRGDESERDDLLLIVIAIITSGVLD